MVIQDANLRNLFPGNRNAQNKCSVLIVHQIGIEERGPEPHFFIHHIWWISTNRGGWKYRVDERVDENGQVDIHFLW